MDKWYLLAVIAVVALGALGFLRVVANEIRAVEKTLELLVTAEKMRQAALQEKEREQAEAA